MVLVLQLILVPVSMWLFFLPFFFWFRRYQKPKKIKESISLSDELEIFFLSKSSNWLVFAWAAGEALIWFVIPEFLLLLVVFMKIKRKRELLVYDVAGTILGTVLALTLSFSDKMIASLPFIRPKMVEQTIAWYDQLGVLGLFYQPFSGVPYKVFTLLASRYDFFIIGFIVLAVLVRMSRYMIFFGLFVGIYPGVHKFVHKNYIKLAIAATFVFTMALLKVVNNYS